MFLEFGPSQSKIWDFLEPKNRKFFTNLALNQKWNQNRNRGNPNWQPYLWRSMSKTLPNLWTLLPFKNKTKSAQNVAKVLTHFGQILDIFLVFWHGFSSLFHLWKIGKNFGHPFGHIKQVWAHFGHIMDILKGLDIFWTHYGHFKVVCVQNVSIPPSCWSTQNTCYRDIPRRRAHVPLQRARPDPTLRHCWILV